MIHANELRLHNYVQVVGTDKMDTHYSRVVGITADEIRVSTDITEQGMGCGESDLNGIELTPELLVKCGFTKDGFGAFNISLGKFQKHFKMLLFSGDYLYIREGQTDQPRDRDDLVTLWNKDFMKHFYLHQLQNVYYALTGKELEVTF